jgi:hypothetical protein
MSRNLFVAAPESDHSQRLLSVVMRCYRASWAPVYAETMRTDRARKIHTVVAKKTHKGMANTVGTSASLHARGATFHRPIPLPQNYYPTHRFPIPRLANPLTFFTSCSGTLYLLSILLGILVEWINHPVNTPFRRGQDCFSKYFSIANRWAVQR